MCVTSTSAGSDSGSTAKPWFCDVISILPVVELLHRMVRAAMAELQLERLAAHRQTENLMPEADAEDRHAGRDQRLRVLDRICQRRRIAGAVAEKHAVGLRSPAILPPESLAGYTRTSHPCALSRRMMFHFIPKS